MPFRHKLGPAIFVAVFNLFSGAAAALINEGALDTSNNAFDVEVSTLRCPA